MHHFNNHTRQEINDYCKKKKKSNKQSQQNDSSSPIFSPKTQEISTYYCSMNTSQNHHNTIEYINSHLFTLKTTINENEIKILVDPGGDRTIISPSLLKKLQLSIKDQHP